MPIVLRPLAERSSLPSRLTDLGRSRKLARVVIGSFTLLAVVLSLVTVGCVLDSTVGLSPLARASLLLVTIAAGGTLFLRAVWRPLREPASPLAVAHLLEANYPKLNDSLASAVDFLSSETSTATSSRFRRIAVVRAQRGLDKCDVRILVPGGRAWQLFWIAAVVLIAAGGLGGWKPMHAGMSLIRLGDPFGAHPWPTKTQIAISDPAPQEFPVRAPLGEAFQLVFTVSGVIPEEAILTVQLANGNRYQEVIAVHADDVTRNRGTISVALEPHRIPESFRFQLRANDAITDWYSVTLAPPPKLVPLDGRPSPQLHVTFPAYTDLPPDQLPDGSGVIEAVHGTRVRLTAATDRPVVSAVLVPQVDRTLYELGAGIAPLAAPHELAAGSATTLAEEAFADIPVSVIDETRLAADFIPKLPGLYALRFTDETGLSGTRLLEFRMTNDPSPVVTLDQPMAGKDPLILLPTASTTIRSSAADRIYALRSMFVEYRVGGPNAPINTLPLVDLTGLGQPLAGVTGAALATQHAKQPSAEASVTLPVSAFRKPDGTPPVDGDRIVIRSAATDFDDVSVLKEPGRSDQEVTILVVSRPALDTILQQELAKLRPTLLKLREQQRAVRQRTEEVQKASADGKTKPDDGQVLGQAERDQRGVRNAVTDPSDGLQQAVDLLKSTILANGVPRSTTTERVETLSADLARLTTQNLDRIEPLIASAKQEVDSPGSDAKKVSDELRKAVSRQKAAEGDLDAMLKLLEQWGGAGEVKAEARALKELLGKAGERAKQVGELVRQGTLPGQLTEKEAGELNHAAEQFDSLAGRANSVIEKAQRLAAEKEAQAKALRAEADAKRGEADAAAAAAAKLLTGSPEATAAASTAEKLAGEASELAADADKAQGEADALRSAVKDAGNQGLVNDLRRAGEELRQNNPAQSDQAQNSAADRLDAISRALTERPPDVVEELKKKEKLADDAFALEREQDELRKKVEAAEKITDPTQREEELKSLAREQEQLRKKAEDLLERLTREREDAAAEKLRDSIEKMDAAQRELEQGNSPKELEREALDRLQDSVDKLDQERAQDEVKLAREKRAELAEKLQAISDRLRATDDEAARIQAEVLKKQGWDRAKLDSLNDLDDRAKAVAGELRQFTAKELEPLPVFKQLADQAAVLTDAAAQRFVERKNDTLDALGDPFDPEIEVAADDRSRRPLRTAIRRLSHILDALAEDKQDPPPSGAQQPNDPMEGGPPGGNGDSGGGDQPTGVPPLAQLKALRNIQAELNTRTREFDQAHPDQSKLTPADRDELTELERSQREVAELFDKMKAEFEKLKPKDPVLP